MSKESLLVLQSKTAFSSLLFNGAPVYLVSISRSGLSTRWSPERGRGVSHTRAEWVKLRARYRDRLGGRLVRATA